MIDERCDNTSGYLALDTCGWTNCLVERRSVSEVGSLTVCCSKKNYHLSSRKDNFLVCKCGDFEPHKKFVKTLTSVKLCSSNRLNRKMHEQLLRFSINSRFRLHYAVQHELEKPLSLLWLFRPSTAHITIRYTTTSITFKHAVVEKLEQS